MAFKERHNIIDLVYQMVVLGKDVEVKTKTIILTFNYLVGGVLKHYGAKNFWFDREKFEIVYKYNGRKIKLYEIEDSK